MATTNRLSQSFILVVGAAVLDIVVKPTYPSKKATFNAASCVECDGGVGRNIVQVVGRLGGGPVLLYTALGQDSRGDAMLGRLQSAGTKWWSPESIVQVAGSNTASFLAILDDKGALSTAYMDMAVLSHIPVPSQEVMNDASFLVVDSNPTAANMRIALTRAKQAGVPVLWDPTSGPKAKALLIAVQDEDFDFFGHLAFATPNLDELFVLAGHDGPRALNTDSYDTATSKGLIQSLCRVVMLKMHPEANLIVTMGSQGVLLACKSTCNNVVEFRHFPVIKGTTVRNETGAGDTFVGFLCVLSYDMAIQLPTPFWWAWKQPS